MEDLQYHSLLGPMSTSALVAPIASINQLHESREKLELKVCVE